MALTPEQIEARLKALEAQNVKLDRTLRTGRTDNRIPLLATGFDIEDAIFSPTARAGKSAAQVISNNTSTQINFNTEKYDTDSMHDNSTNPSRITFNTAGKYLLTASVAFESNTTGRRAVWFRINGATAIEQDEPDTNGNDATWINVSSVFEFVKGDYAEVLVYQNSGGDLSVNRIADRTPIFTATWLAP